MEDQPMRSLQRWTLIVTFLSLTAGGTISAPLPTAAGPETSSTPRAAGRQLPQVQDALDQLQREGFQLQRVDEEPVHYLVEPSGAHFWGHVRYVLTRSVGPRSLEFEVKEIAVPVTASGTGFLAQKAETRDLRVYE
jgi:hypothetical protein